ncbi:MAG TPA: CHASE3 domain-containing protein [Candidatus Acidoferrales bacterium]|jgi:PAS domain S-box-containing protein|nr:CHASE3 domain-containing protein [Candidatus Acidoferrales bacterium]
MVLLASALLLIAVLQLLPERDFQRARDAEHLVEHTLRVLRASAQLLTTVEAAEAGQRGYLLTGDKLDLEPFETALSNQAPARRNLRQLTANNSRQQARVARLDKLVETRFSELSRIIGLSQAEGRSAALAAVATDEDRRVIFEIRDLLSDLEQEEYELLPVRTKAAEAKANHTRWILSALLMTMLAAGGAVSERDVSNHQRDLEAIRNSEERFRTLADAIPQLSWMAHADGWVFWYNQRWYDFTGVKPQDTVGWGWQSVHDPEVLPAVLVGWKKAIADGEPFEMVFPLRAVDGAFHPFLTRVMPMRDQAGKVVRWFGTSTDITAQRMTEDALRENQQRLRVAQQVARIGTFEWNLQTGVKQRTPELEAMYGLPPGGFDAGRRTWLDLVHPEDREQADRHMQEALETGSFEAEWRVNWPDGATHWLFGRAWVFQGDTGKRSRMIGAVVDVTARKQAELEVLRINGELERRVHDRTIQLEAANRELEAFAYSVSHDLRAPLRGIDGWSLALLEDYDSLLDEGARQYLNRVRSETQRMGHLIDGLLQLSRVSRGEMKFHRVDLTALANTIAARLRDSQPERSLEFVIEPELVASGDGRLLEIALTNLFSNAVKFTGARDQALIEFGRVEQDGEMAFYVRDNGAGFDMAHAGNLFGAFQRLHKASEFPGTGIGLATVQRVVRRHGGRVWADGCVNRGATFSFTLGASS